MSVKSLPVSFFARSGGVDTMRPIEPTVTAAHNGSRREWASSDERKTDEELQPLYIRWRVGAPGELRSTAFLASERYELF